MTKKSNGFVADQREHDLARGLGWFSVALGIVQLLTPRRVGRAAGVGDRAMIMRLCGLRELMTGIGILTQPNPSRWLRARVAGDLLDLALLGGSFASAGSRVRLAAATAAVAGVTAMDWKCSQRFAGDSGANISAIHVSRAITIARSPEELFRFWRRLENLPQFMNHLELVRVINDKQSHWVAKGPGGASVEWDAEITGELPNEMIAWRSMPGSTVDNSGSVRFSRATGGRGTVVKVELQFTPPAGVLGVTVAKLFGQSPAKQIAVDLLRFKQLMEAGEIARTEGQPAGRARSTSRKFDDLARQGV